MLWTPLSVLIMVPGGMAADEPSGVCCSSSVNVQRASWNKSRQRRGERCEWRRRVVRGVAAAAAAALGVPAVTSGAGNARRQRRRCQLACVRDGTQP
jgi:hypothetical protein